MNQQQPIRYFLFPHAVMAEPEARLLALFLPNLHLLEILNPVQLPDWSRSHFVSYPALQDQDLSERVRRYLHESDYAEVIETRHSVALGTEKHHEAMSAAFFCKARRGRRQRPDSPPGCDSRPRPFWSWHTN
jgi:hypothetical protein